MVGVAGVLLGATANPAQASAPTFVLQGYWNIGGFSPTRDGSLAGAIDAFGTPSSLRAAPAGQSQNFCVVRWTRYGITMNTYLIAEPGQNCTSKTRHWTTRLTDRRWRTLKGLHIGDALQRLKRLYPDATAAKRGWWPLVTKDLLGIGEPYSMVQAHVVSGRVKEFLVFFPSGGI
jgi:hypothetical protein